MNIRVIALCEDIYQHLIDANWILLIQCTSILVIGWCMGQSEDLRFPEVESLAAHHMSFSG